MGLINSDQYYEYVYYKTLSDTNINKFFPNGIQKEAVYYIISEHQKGKRSEGICKDLKNIFSNIKELDLKDITQTICSMASSAETQFKSKTSNINWYLWTTSEDQRVRNSHKEMNDVLVNFDNPPSPENLIGEESVGLYNAGECFKCRCFPSPVVRLKFITWPHKVYYNKTIQTMTQKEFENIM